MSIMARLYLSALLLLLLTLALSEGLPDKPKKVKCQDKKFPLCYHKKLLCPDACLRDCVVDCKSCQPVCTPPPPPPPPPPRRVRCRDRNFRQTCHKDLFCPATCPKTCAVDCVACQPICAPLPPTTTFTPPPPAVVLSSPPPPPPPSVVVTPSSPPPPVVLTPSVPPPPPVVVVVTPSPPPDSSEAAGGKRVRCKNKNFPDCYFHEHRCPVFCPDQCEVDCVSCSPVCNCNKPGAVCQDPRFVGADGITFYFHGKKEKDFCIVSDKNLHINAHFIGKRNENMGRDFTWVQSLGILFDTHQISVAAKKTATWDNNVDRLQLFYNGESVALDEGEGAKWRAGSATITRSRDTNEVVIEVEGNFKIKAAVVPITEKDSRIHKYGITDEDCFAHLDLGFKFFSLTDNVNGVLGQTYASNYVSRVKMGVDMPVLGGKREFASSSLFSTDCAVARFDGMQSNSTNSFQYANLNCASGLDGRGVVCKR